MMALKVILPTKILIEENVKKIITEDKDGSFCLLPRHVDFTTAITPGLLIYQTTDEKEEYIALNEGILVKCKEKVSIATKHAIKSPDLGKLDQIIDENFKVLDEYEKKVFSILVELESDFIRKYMEVKKYE